MNASFFRLFLFLIMIGLMQSCTSITTRFVKLNSQSYQPTDPDKVELFLTKTPNREYEEIAIVYADVWVSGNALLHFKKAAARLGADAVIHVTGAYRNMVGVAVKWK